jgi:hypothetical protein
MNNIFQDVAAANSAAWVKHTILYDSNAKAPTEHVKMAFAKGEEGRLLRARYEAAAAARSAARSTTGKE